MSSETIKNCLDYSLFSWSKQAGLDPIHVVKGEGVNIYDANGKKYLDFSSLLMNVNIGRVVSFATETKLTFIAKINSNFFT